MSFFRRTKPETRRALDPTTGEPIPKTKLFHRLMIKLLSDKVRTFAKNWKTSLAGLALLGQGIGALAGHAADFAGGADFSLPSTQIAWGMITAGIAAICAKDGDKSGK